MVRVLMVGVMGLLLQGCGIVLFPISVPVAIASNKILAMDGRIVDEEGHALRNATVKVTESHVYPSGNPLRLTDTLDTQETLAAPDGNMHILRRCQDVTLAISCPGFYGRVLVLNDRGLWEKLPQDGRRDPTVGDWYGMAFTAPISGKSPYVIALDRKEHPANLILYDRWPDEDLSHMGVVMDLDRAPPPDGPMDEYDLRKPLPANCLYVQVERDSADHFAGQLLDPKRPHQYDGDLLPHSLKLVSTSKQGGLIKIATRNGRPAEERIRTAPESGYQHELVLDVDDQRKLWNGSAGVPFYVKTDTGYGRGMIHFVLCQYGSPGLTKVTLCYELFLQPDGSRNVE